MSDWPVYTRAGRRKPCRVQHSMSIAVERRRSALYESYKRYKLDELSVRPFVSSVGHFLAEIPSVRPPVVDDSSEPLGVKSSGESVDADKIHVK